MQPTESSINVTSNNNIDEQSIVQANKFVSQLSIDKDDEALSLRNYMMLALTNILPEVLSVEDTSVSLQVMTALLQVKSNEEVEPHLDCINAFSQNLRSRNSSENSRKIIIFSLLLQKFPETLDLQISQFLNPNIAKSLLEKHHHIKIFSSYLRLMQYLSLAFDKMLPKIRESVEETKGFNINLNGRRQKKQDGKLNLSQIGIINPDYQKYFQAFLRVESNFATTLETILRLYKEDILRSNQVLTSLALNPIKNYLHQFSQRLSRNKSLCKFLNSALQKYESSSKELDDQLEAHKKKLSEKAALQNPKSKTHGKFDQFMKKNQSSIDDEKKRTVTKAASTIFTSMVEEPNSFSIGESVSNKEVLMQLNKLKSLGEALTTACLDYAKSIHEDNAFIDEYIVHEEWDDYIPKKLPRTYKSIRREKATKAHFPRAAAAVSQKDNHQHVPQSNIEHFITHINDYSITSIIPESMKLLITKLPRKIQANSAQAGIAYQESLHHLFFSGCGLELYFTALMNRDLKSLGSIIPMLIMDWHVQIEQLATMETLKLGESISHSHSLTATLRQANLLESTSLEMQGHLFNLDQGLIWSRYPASSLYRSKRQLPSGLKWLSFSHDLLAISNELKVAPSKEQIKELTKFILHSHSQSLTYFTTSTVSDPEVQNLITLFGSGNIVEKKLMQTIDEMYEIIPTGGAQAAQKNETPSENQALIAKAVGIIQKQLQAPSTESSRNGIYQATLQDVRLHLLRLSASLALSTKTKASYFSAWHARNLMNLQWIFEQIYVSQYFIKYQETPYMHDFSLFQTLLGLQKSNPEEILKYNYGIGIHYPCKFSEDPFFADFVHVIEEDCANYGNHSGFTSQKHHQNSSSQFLNFLLSDLQAGLLQVIKLLEEDL